MKIPAKLVRLSTFAAVALPLVGYVGCAQNPAGNGTAERRRIPLAPVGVSSPGIGAPGAGSMDTRGTGTIASGQGDNPIGDPNTGSVPASAGGTTPGARNGGRL